MFRAFLYLWVLGVHDIPAGKKLIDILHINGKMYLHCKKRQKELEDDFYGNIFESRK